LILVADASTLITLARIGRLDLLRQLAGTVHIPEAVYGEVVTRGAGRPGTGEIAQAEWISRRAVRDRTAVDRLRSRVGQGEAEAIVLARELGADALILDDATARRVAEAEGQRVVGLLGLLLEGKKRAIVSVVRPLLDEMIAAGYFVDDALYRLILQQAGEESPP
jgi:predicted nucleic acid-binding protein